MYTNPYLVLNEKGRPQDALFCFFSFPDSPVSPPCLCQKETLFFSLSFNLYCDQYEVMPHFIILGKTAYIGRSPMLC